MERGNKGSSNGEMVGSSRNKRGSFRILEIILRVLALGLTLVSAIVLGVNKQTAVVPITISPMLPPLNVPVSAKWHYLSAFVFFVVVNAIACSYAAFSLILTLVNKGKKPILALVIIILDLMMVALLFSGNGAAIAVGILGYKGNSHVRWNKVCGVFGRFCHQVAASFVLSVLGSLAFLLLVLVAALNLHKRIPK